MYLLDTNTVIYYLNASLPTNGMLFLNGIVDSLSNISLISKIELLGFDFKNVEEENTMIEFVNGSVILGINDDIVNTAIALRKTKKIKLPDAIIAATSLVNQLTLVSRNTSDFKTINGLQTVNPWDI